MQTVLRILMVEDVTSDAERALHVLKHARIAYEVRRVGTENEFVEQLDTFKPDLVLSDFTLPHFDGLSALRLVCEKRPDMPFIFVSGALGEERTVEMLKSGAADYVMKSNLARLPTAVRRAMREAEVQRQEAWQRAQAVRLSNVRAMQGAIASAIVRGQDSQALLEAACAIAVEHGGFRMAWIGQVTPHVLSLTPVASNGHNAGYLDAVAQIAGTELTQGRGQSTVPWQNGAVVVQDIENNTLFVLREEALARGYRSMIALPLMVENKLTALLKIYADKAEYFGPEEIKILTEVADDLSFALSYRAKQEKLSHFANHDVLTGLPNRRLLHKHLKQELVRAGRLKNSVAVVFVDLDHFKSVNDTLGHGTGDRVLREVSSQILACTREGDLVARLGGDEFVMVLPMQSDRETAELVIQRVLETVSHTIRIGNHKLNVGCSIGVAVYPQDGKDSETLLCNADAAMYRAKKNPGQPSFYFHNGITNQTRTPITQELDQAC
jgi:diguanylate cyclase (GGDEF)-like protein